MEGGTRASSVLCSRLAVENRFTQFFFCVILTRSRPFHAALPSFLRFVSSQITRRLSGFLLSPFPSNNAHSDQPGLAWPRGLYLGFTDSVPLDVISSHPRVCGEDTLPNTDRLYFTFFSVCMHKKDALFTDSSPFPRKQVERGRRSNLQLVWPAVQKRKEGWVGQGLSPSFHFTSLHN